VTNGDSVGQRSLARVLVAVVVVAVLLAGALFAAIGSLNRDMYSASGFVRQYLEALARHDTTSALALAGVRPTDAQLQAASLPQNLPETLLRASVLGSLTDIELAGDRETKPGLHTVKYSFTLNGKPSAMEFRVQGAGTFAGVFNSWRFSASPLAVLQVTVMHASEFTVNGLTLDARAHAAAAAPATFSNQAAYLAFAPTAYTFGHESALLTAPKTTVPVVASGATDVTVDAEPNASFVGQVQTELNKFLDECATQQVLQPSNCPFGMDIDDRVKGLPTWSIAEYPPVTLAAGESTFDMPDTTGQAHIVVVVQSLFDGEVSTRDENVPFSVGLSVTINPDGSLRIQLH
jgi:type II secretory pathway pseudopilin PulG